MKIEKNFSPIKIVIETQDELTALRDALGYFVSPGVGSEYVTYTQSNQVALTMFEKIRAI